MSQALLIRRTITLRYAFTAGRSGEGEFDEVVAEDQIVGEASGFPDVVRGGHAVRLRVVVGGYALRADAVRVQALEDRVGGEVRRYA